MIDIEDYYRNYGPMVYRRCLRLLGDDASASEAMQDTFVHLISKQSELKNQAPSSLLYTIATHVCLNLIRTRARTDVSSAEERILLQIADQTRPDEAFAARDFLSRLFAREKESTAAIAVMFHVDEMTLEEIAVEVGLSVSGVRKRLRNLRLAAANVKESV